MAGIPIALRDRLYSYFFASLKSSNSISDFEKQAESLVSNDPETWEYLQDRLPRFEKVLMRWVKIRVIADALEQDLTLGAALFNEGLYFDCHEYLEGAWRRSKGGEKIMVQGLIQAAAGFHKLELGSPGGCAELLGKAIEKLFKIEDARWSSLQVFAVELEKAGSELRTGNFDLSRVPKLGTISL